MTLKKFHGWSEEKLGEKLYSLEPNNSVIVYSAEEQIVDDDFDPQKMPRQKSISFIFGGIYYKKLEKYYGVNLHFWSNFWLYQSVNLINKNNLKKKSKFKHLFISLNNESHEHRCRMIDILAKNNLVKKNVISWNKANRSKYKFRYWKEKIIHLSDNYNKTKEQHLIPGEFNKCFLNLVLESTIEGIFVTEKTYHPILCEKPFICLAAPKFHEFLETQGFKLYNEIISYDFDKEYSLDKRIDMIVKQLRNLQSQNYDKLYEKIKPTLDYNKKRALEIVRNQEGIPEIARNFKYYNNIIKEAVCKSDTLE